MRDANTDALIWQANALNAYGQVALETAGNGLTTARTLQTGTPFVGGISTGNSGAVQSLGYTWSAFGHVETRSDGNQGLTETFTYDLLNRVETAMLTVQGSGAVTTFDADYDAVGNITQKLGVGGYTYHATKKHAVVQAGGTSYTYDGNGNQLTRGGIAQDWTVANLPKTLRGNGYQAEFKYGPSRARYQQVATYSGRTETTLTLGGFERLVRSDRPGAEVRYRVSAGGIPVAEVKDSTSTNTRTVSYLHRDHLGSVDTVTDESGAVVARMSFDVHGNRRAATGAGTAWQTGLKYPTATAAIDALRDKTPRGYTDHEMLDNVGLVHMDERWLVGDLYFAPPTIRGGLRTLGPLGK